MLVSNTLNQSRTLRYSDPVTRLACARILFTLWITVVLPLFKHESKLFSYLDLTSSSVFVCVDCVIVIENGTCEPSSNSVLICCIHFHANLLGKSMNQFFFPLSAMGYITEGTQPYKLKRQPV